MAASSNAYHIMSPGCEDSERMFLGLYARSPFLSKLILNHCLWTLRNRIAKDLGIKIAARIRIRLGPRIDTRSDDGDMFTILSN